MLPITPLELDSWAARDAARRELPALMTRLALSRALDVTAIDFPAYESTNEGGWDGQVTSAGSDPWVPKGQSFWELSCQARTTLKAKASADYAKRLEQTDSAVRRRSTFVFVTPRKWPGKTTWRAEKAAASDWSDVRVYDADNLSDWIGQAPAALSWLSEALGRSADHLCSLDHLWTEWAGVTAPKLKPGIFEEAITETEKALASFLAAPPVTPFVVTGENRAESAAFVAAALQTDEFRRYSLQAVAARTPAGIQALKALAGNLVVLITSPEAELALGDLTSRAHVIIAADRSDEDLAAGGNIQPLTWKAFTEAMNDLEVEDDERARLELESGYRIAVLRRRLSHLPSIRSPAWSRESTPALVGLALAGGWYWKREGDRQSLTQLSGLSSQDEVEANIRRYAAMTDAPIFAVADAGGVISRHDTFGALRHVVTRKQLREFFEITKAVLSEGDPSLELPKDQRWYASVLGKERQHSGRLRQSMAETAAFLAAVGKGLFGSSLSFDCEQAAAQLVRDLLAKDDDDDRWLRSRDVLKSLAEAAPDAFLDALERDLPHEAENRGVWQTIATVEGANQENYRATLCWALERLAWTPRRFPRVAKVLAHLSTRPLNDNWVNKPSESLYACFQPFLPQTMASVQTRCDVLREIDRSFPEVGWALALRIVDQRLGRGTFSNRPRYRRDSAQDDSDRQNRHIGRAAFNLLLSRSDKTLAQILDLVDKSPAVDGAEADQLWDVVEAWSNSANEAAAAAIRERIRRVALWRRRGGKRRPENARAQRLHDQLQIADPRHGHAWLFENRWLEFGSDELWDEKLDHNARERRVAERREAAVREIWAKGGLEAVLEFALETGAPDVVGDQLSKIEACAPLSVAALLQRDLAERAKHRDAFVRSYLYIVGPEPRARLLDDAIAAWGEQSPHLIALLHEAPTGPETWQVVDRLSEPQQRAFWSGLKYLSLREGPDVSERICRELLRVGRATVAFNQAHFEPEVLTTEVILDVLHGVAFTPSPENEAVPLNGHGVDSMFEELDKRDDVNLDRARHLEFAYAQHFSDDHGRKLNFLSRALADDPAFLAEAVKRTYRRSDGEVDAEEDLKPEVARQNATHWHHVLSNVHLPPGAGADGEIDPQRIGPWMQKVREMLESLGRLSTGETCIGQIVGQSIEKTVETWPSSEVAKALEPWVSEDFSRGLYLGIVNSRGAVWRGKGGDQERVLAERYRSWVKPLLVPCPKLARAIEEVAKSYDRHAEAEDKEEEFRRKSGSH